MLVLTQDGSTYVKLNFNFCTCLFVQSHPKQLMGKYTYYLSQSKGANLQMTEFSYLAMG